MSDVNSGWGRGEPRAFSKSQRRALFDLAGGVCESCGDPLGDDWEAHHETAYAHGGLTEIGNGAAFCRPCNRSAGAAVRKRETFPLREWQRELDVHVGFNHKKQSTFSVTACPASGKTYGILNAVAFLRSVTARPPVIVAISPSVDVRDNWARAAQDHFGLSLLWRRSMTGPDGRQSHLDWAGGSRVFASGVSGGYDGVSLTYQWLSSAGNARLVADLSKTHSVIAIMDEVHHAANEKAFGDSLEVAFGGAEYRILATGTPFRHDGARISFATYDNKGLFVPQVSCSYARAIEEKIVRPVHFTTTGGTQEWETASGPDSADFSAELPRREASLRRATALSPASDLLEESFKDADKRLDSVRMSIPDAAGIFVARDQEHARHVSRMIYRLTGKPPALAISDGDNFYGQGGASGRDVIGAFRKGGPSGDRWIVCVGMVSEGVDIPRLKVLVYGTRTLTKLFFMQVIGRILRQRPGDPWGSSFVFIYNDALLVAMAMDILKEVQVGLKEKETPEPEGGGECDDSPPSPPPPPSTFRPVGGEGVFKGVVDKGDLFDATEVERAEYFTKGLGLKIDSLDLARLQRGFEEEQRAKAARAAYEGRQPSPEFSQRDHGKVMLEKGRLLRDLINKKIAAASVRAAVAELGPLTEERRNEFYKAAVAHGWEDVKRDAGIQGKWNKNERSEEEHDRMIEAARAELAWRLAALGEASGATCQPR